MNNKQPSKFLIAFVLIVAIALAYLALTREEPQEADEAETNIGTDVVVEPTGKVVELPESDCPDFEDPAEPTQGEGWTVYARQDLCYSFEYPDGWGIKEISKTKSVHVRRIEDLNTTTTFSLDETFASFGINEVNPESLPLSTHIKNIEDLIVGNNDCSAHDFNGQPLMTCVQLAEDGRTFVLSYSLHPSKSNESVIIQMMSTVVIW